MTTAISTSQQKSSVTEMLASLFKNTKHIQKATMVNRERPNYFNNKYPLSLQSPKRERDTPRVGLSYLKSSSTAWGKVWKLLFRLIWLLSLMATFPNI